MTTVDLHCTYCDFTICYRGNYIAFTVLSFNLQPNKIKKNCQERVLESLATVAEYTGRRKRKCY